MPMKVNAFTHDEFFHRINADMGRCDHKDRVSARPFVDPLRISTEMIVGAAIINVGLIDVKIPTLSIWNDLVRRGVEAFYCTAYKSFDQGRAELGRRCAISSGWQGESADVVSGMPMGLI